MPKTLTELVETVEDRDQLALALTDAWAGLDNIDIVAQVVAFAFEEVDDDDDDGEDEDGHDWMDCPEPGEPVPPELLDPQTLTHVVCKLERDAYAQGDEDLACAASTIRQCLRIGDVQKVAKALVRVAELLADD